MWGVEEESWLQQAKFAKPRAIEPVEGSYAAGVCSSDALRISYRKIISSRDFEEVFRENGYAEEWKKFSQQESAILEGQQDSDLSPD